MKVVIENDNVGERVDRYLTEVVSESYPYITRVLVQEHLKEGVKVNDESVKRSYKLKEGDVVDIDMEYWGGLKEGLDLSENIIAQCHDLDIRYEDDDLLVVFKPKGLVVHPGVGNKENTLANYVRGYLEGKGEYDSLVDRGGIVHRLDKGVSGLMVIAKSKESQEFLKRQFQEHTVVKIYEASVEESGKCNDLDFIDFKNEEISVDGFIANLNVESLDLDSWYSVEGYIGRSSRNRYKMEFKKYEFGGSKFAKSYIKKFNDRFIVKIETGRMHQIRATLEYLGMHILGDDLYGVRGRSYENDDIELESVVISFNKLDGSRLTVKKYE